MVRLADLPEWDRISKLDKLKELTGFDARPWVKPPPLKKCRIAIVTTAGVHRRGDRPFQEDHNIAFPIDRLNELAQRGVVGAVADLHYSFMGATQIRQLEAKAKELAQLLKDDHVDAVLLTPI